MDVAFAFSVIFTGVTIVFLVLLLLILVMYLLGKLAGEKPQRAAPPPPQRAEPLRPAAAPAPAKAAPKLSVESGIAGETVAVIAAAVSTFTEGRGQVVAVSRAQGGKASRAGARSAWSLAGLRENTSPF